jgi:hypothetical protein
VQSKAKTVQQYLKELPPDRRAAIQAVREVILKNLDKDYEECMNYGMIGYVVPHRVHPAGYHCDPKQPMPFACLASQKNHMAVYLMSACDPTSEGEWFRKAWAKTGKKLDMGKSCIRFKKIEDVPLDVIGEAVRRMPVKKYLAWIQEVFADMAARRGPNAGAAKAKAKAKAKAAGKSKAVRSARAGR